MAEMTAETTAMNLTAVRAYHMFLSLHVIVTWYLIDNAHSTTETTSVCDFTLDIGFSVNYIDCLI